MFLNKHTLLICLVLAASSFAEQARAEGKACILQNNEGADQQAQHHLLAARTAYLACSSAESCPDVVRDECQQGLMQLSTAIPSVVIAVVDAQHRDLGQATLTLDGKTIAHDGTALELDPGPHQLAAASGTLRAELEVVASEGERNRHVELVLVAPTSATPVDQPAAPAAQERSHVPSYVLGGVGILAAGSFGYFALTGHSQMSDLNRCKPYCERSDVKSVQTKYLIADISLGVSVVALGTATYLWLRKAPSQEAEQAKLSVDVLALPSFAGLNVRWSQ
jgi:hypothetical protein